MSYQSVKKELGICRLHNSMVSNMIYCKICDTSWKTNMYRRKVVYMWICLRKYKMKEGGTSGKFRSNIDLKIIQQVVVGGGFPSE